MFRWVFVIAVVLGLASNCASAAPFIFYRGIFNAGSFAPSALPNGSIARGSIFAVFGRDMGPAVGVEVSQFPLGTSFEGVEIKVCQDGECVDAIPLFVRQDQINAIMPSDAPLGPVSIQVCFNGEQGNFSPAAVVEHSVGIFSVNARGVGPGIVQNFNAADDQPLNSPITTARPGQVVIAWVTGLGAGLNADNVTPQVGDLPVNVEIFVGGVQVTNKLYSGRSAQFAGADQIIFEIPANTPLGCYVPIHFRTGGQTVSNSSTIAIGEAGSPCEDAGNPLRSLQPGGKTGAVFLARFVTQLPFIGVLGISHTSDIVAAAFQEEPLSSWRFHRLLSLRPLEHAPATGSALICSPAQLYRRSLSPASPWWRARR